MVTNIQPDFEEFLRLLEEQKVEYLVVGGYAVAHHGFPRYTKDLDIFYRRSGENIGRLKRALIEFGFDETSFAPSDFSSGQILKIGIEPLRIDLLNEIDGVVFEHAITQKMRDRYGQVEISYIGKKDLMKNKESSGRPQDLADLEKLRALN